MKGSNVLKEKLANLLKGVTLALLYILVYVVAQAVFDILGVAVFSFFGANPGDVINNLGIILVFSALTSLIIYLATFYMRKISINKVICTKNTSFTDVILAMVLAIGCRLLTGVYIIWAEKTPVFKEALEAASENYDFSTMTGLDIILLFACVSVLAPVFEEILFRSIVMRELSTCMPVGFAIVIQGILFGLVHGNLVQLVFTSVIGILLGFIYYKTKNLVISILVHLFFNCSAVLEVKDESILPVTVAIGVAMVVVSVIMMIYTHRNKTYVVCD